MKPIDYPGTAGAGSRSTLTYDSCRARLERIPFRTSSVVLFTMSVAVFFDIADQQGISFVAPSMRQALGFSVADIATLVSATYLGMLMGANVGGYLSDRIGRIRVIRISMPIASLGTLSYSLAQDLPTFWILRLFSGVALGALYVAAVTYTLEASPPSRRDSRVAAVSFFGTCAGVALAWFSRFAIPLGADCWRLVFAIGGVGLLVVIPAASLPESPLWLITRGRMSAAETAMNRLEGARSSRRKPDPVEPNSSRPTIEDTARNHRTLSSYTELWRHPLRRSTALLIGLWVFFQLAVLTFGTWLPTILQFRGFDSEQLLTINAVAIFGAPVGGLLAVVLSRFCSRTALMVGAALTAASAAVLFGAVTQASIVTAAAFVLYSISGMFIPLAASSTAAQYPTRLRTTGSGLGFSIGRLASIVAPFVVASILATAGEQAIAWVLTSSWIVVGTVSIGLRQRYAGSA